MGVGGVSHGRGRGEGGEEELADTFRRLMVISVTPPSERIR